MLKAVFQRRASLLLKVERRIAQKSKPGRGYALLVVDIESCQKVSDSLGEDAAEAMMREVGLRIDQTFAGVRGGAVVRLRTSEYVLLIDDVASEEDALTFSGLLQYLLARPFGYGAHQVCISASIGIAFGNASTHRNAEEILSDADVAMHRAKYGGKGKCIVFAEHMREEALSRLKLEADLRNALRDEQFEVYYQPKVRLETGAVKGFEALIRWKHPLRGFVSPLEFIPVAEEMGLMSEIGRWVAAQAIRQLATWQNRGIVGPDTTMAINISAQQFMDDGLLRYLKEELVLAGVPFCCLVLEITESLLVEDSASVIETMEDIVSDGIGLDLDDFGTGFSSLSYLHRFPFRAIKIDQSFVRRMSTDPQSVKLVAAIVVLAGSLGMGVIAEGVETSEQLSQLVEMQCPVAQGYLFSRPQPARQMETFLLEGGASVKSMHYGNALVA